MSNNPPVKSKGDYHGKPHPHTKAGPLPNPLPTKPTARESGYAGTDRVK
ncbi:MAG: hypothetical protein JWO52_3342 [Gammaproteobacteria bacterium]|nr:hypothetical protein [Gammaproteobacteria bacterium]